MFLCDAEAFAVTVAATAACGPFSFICSFVVSEVDPSVPTVLRCTEAYGTCLRSCHAAGTSCCPVNCGGAGDIATPIGACCESGESCLSPSTTSFFSSGHVAICCSSGQTPCGGVECCGSNSTCMSTGSGGPQQCCTPSQINAQGQCCPNGINFVTDQCCGIFGACTAGGTCSGSNQCVNGCCTLG
jgi:hypothetical protein